MSHMGKVLMPLLMEGLKIQNEKHLSDERRWF